VNKQLKIVDGVRISTGIEWTDYTWNPVGGCKHGCRWSMPDGTVATCYAGDVAGGLARRAYPHGFEHHYWHPQRLDEPLKLEGAAKIFVGSMTDLFGHWVPARHIDAVLFACEEVRHHTFQLLTKNPGRAIGYFMPGNVWLGASVAPDWMNGKRLTRSQQETLLRKSLLALAESDAWVKFMSFEPLAWDCAPAVGELVEVLDWAIVGAASKGRSLYPPDEGHLRALVDLLDDLKVPVFFKGNLRSSEWAREHWREEWPVARGTVDMQRRCW
jgi:protein gp37